MRFSVDEFVVDSNEEGAGAGVDPRRALLLPLWRGRKLVIAATLLGMLGGLVAGVLRPNSYRSYGKLVIRAGAREETTPEIAVTGNAGNFAMVGQNVVINELHLLGAMQVFEETARIVTPAEVFRPYDPARIDTPETPGVLAMFHGWQSWWFANASSTPSDLPDHVLDDCERCVRAAALAISRDLTRDPAPGSNVITVSFPAHDPELARKVVAAYLEACVRQHRKFYEMNPALELLGGHMEAARRELTKAENEFTNFKTECGVYDFENQQRTLITEIQNLENQTATDKGTLEGLRARTARLEKLVSAEPATIEDTVEHNFQANPDRTPLLTYIYQLEENLRALDGRVSGGTEELERERKSITQSLERERAKLDKMPEFRDTGPAVRTLANPRLARLTEDLDDARVELDALEASATVRSGQLVEQRALLVKMVNCGDRFQFLSGQTTDARNRFEAFRTRHERASLVGSMDQIEMSNLRRIEDASLPNEKEGPQRGKLLMLGILLGGVAGCGLAFARHMLDHRLHDAAEAEQLLGLPVLGAFPDVRALPGRSAKPAKPGGPSTA